MPDVTVAVSDLTDARQHVRGERRATERQHQAFEQFRQTVVETDPVSAAGVEARPTSSGWTAGATGTTGDRCRRIRSAFEEQVVPHVDVTVSAGVRGALASELSTEVAVALAAEGGGNRFTAPLRQAILDHVSQRLAESRVMLRALARERSSLDDVIEALKRADRSLPSADDSTLLLADDGELWDRRTSAVNLADELETALRARQSTLDAVTAADVKAGISHDTVVEYLFGDCDTTYPALDALLRGIRECRRRRDRLEDAVGAQ
ncbi:MAG: hypothetical protein ABEI27_09200 [Halobellus sp.]|uniref:DUF7260 family protein n=1 Tax=Halobellus sp. TaxID=1979212 RepID=UPI0035D49E0A